MDTDFKYTLLYLMSKDSKGQLQIAMHNNLAVGKEYLGEGPKRSLYRLSVTDRRLLFYIIAEGIKNHRSDKEIPSYYEIRVQDIAGYMGVKHSELYNQIRKSIRRLQTTLISYTDPTDGHIVEVTWLSEGRYWEGEGRIRVGITQALKPVLTGLKEQYTLMDLATCGKLGSGYAMRLYELLKSKQKLKHFLISIEELREILSVTNGKFPRFSAFNKYLLQPAINQIEKRTDLKIRYGKGNPRGRKWTHIAFEIKVKTATEMKMAEKVEDEYIQTELIPEFKELFKQAEASLAEV